MRFLTLICLCLVAACNAAPKQADKITKISVVETSTANDDQNSVAPTISKPADVTGVRFKGKEKFQDNLSKCIVERGQIQSVLEEFELVSTSPDGTNSLYSNGGFLGGDHNVFDELTAIIKGDGNRAIIVTPTEFITITVKGAGIGVHFSGGKLRCSGISRF